MSLRTLYLLFALLVASIAAQASGVVNGYFNVSREAFAFVQLIGFGFVHYFRPRKESRGNPHRHSPL